MTARIVVSCDGTAPSTMRCRGALPTRAVWTPGGPRTAEAFRQAFREATAAGWNCATDDGRDLCPACARRAP